MKKLLFAVCLTVLFSAVVSASAHAAITGLINETTYNGHTYGITNGGSSWTDAEAFAVTQGGHLVTINDASENAFLYSTYVAPPGVAPADYWIGLNDPTNGNIAVAGNWVWVSGDSSSYRNWRPTDQPDTGTGSDYYGVIGYIGTAEWDNFPNTGFQSPAAIVEIASVSVPEPATMLLLGFGLVGLAGVRRKFKK